MIRPSNQHARTRTPQILAIGASTGGPQALAEVLSHLPADLPVPVVIVQHMPANFTHHLAERLDAASPLTIREAKAGELLRAGTAWIAPGDFHMTLSGRAGNVITRLNQGPQENYCRPAVDVLFRSVAEVYGERTLAVVLTGMGQDGLRGCERIHAAGGQIVVQDEPSSVVWGMPGVVARAGLACEILPLHDIARRLIAILKGQGAESAALA